MSNTMPGMAAGLRFAIRAIVVLLVATMLSLVGWWFCISPRVPHLAHLACRVLDWPVAFIGAKVFPNHFAGIDLFYGTNMCDFCTASELLVEHAKFAIPVYCVIQFALWHVVTIALTAFRTRTAA